MLGKPVGFGRTAEIMEWGPGRVVKLYRPGFSRAVVEREAAAASLASAAGAPTPDVFEVVQIEGRLGIVFERVSGPTMIEDMARRPWTMPAHARHLAELQARLHRLTVTGLPEVRGLLAQKAERSSRLSPAQRAAVARCLDGLPDGSALCHGDLHPDNVILTERGAVLIDWMDAACGRPAADATRTSLMLRLSLPPEGRASRWSLLARSLFHHLYLRRYLQLRPASASQMASWELPVAAARTAEGLPKGEIEALLAVVDMRLAAAAPPG